MVIPYLAFLVLLAGERVLELALSRRHAAWARARGGIEVGQRQLPCMTALHAALFPACIAEVLWLDRPFIAALGVPMLGLALAAQALRYWAVRTLGPFWNIRVIVVPGARVVTRGPYRYLRHPNYLAVLIEGLAVPLLHTAWITAIAFTLLDVPLLALRIRSEERALVEHCDYEPRLGHRPRLLPRRSLAAAGPPRGQREQ